ncbi:hypothetical protein LUQ84_001815 [Hamiltosporidium tvaerminnensis]|nr:hypothetical protein LUQ84_001815 [Hamiltosporidium tvaerminnensis]
MIGLQEINYKKENTLKFNRSVDQSFYITELSFRDIDEMIDLLQNLAMNEKFDFKATSKAKADLESSPSPLNFLFQNYDISSIKKLIIRVFSIDNSDVKALCNLLSLKELNIYGIKFKNISFSELFCANQEYKIKRMKLFEMNISEQDLIFIENLKKIEDIIFISCDIQGNTYNEIKMLFVNEGYIELKYNTRKDNLREETINYISEKFKTKYIVIRRS